MQGQKVVFDFRLQIDIALRDDLDCLANLELKWFNFVLAESFLCLSVQYLSFYHADDGIQFVFFVVLLAVVLFCDFLMGFLRILFCFKD